MDKYVPLTVALSKGAEGAAAAVAMLMVSPRDLHHSENRHFARLPRRRARGHHAFPKKPPETREAAARRHPGVK